MIARDVQQHHFKCEIVIFTQSAWLIIDSIIGAQKNRVQHNQSLTDNVSHIYRRIHPTKTERLRKKWPMSKCRFNVQLNFNLDWPFPLQHGFKKKKKKRHEKFNLSVHFQRLVVLPGHRVLPFSLSSWSSFSRSNADCTLPELKVLSTYFRMGRTGKLSRTWRLQPTVLLHWITFTPVSVVSAVDAGFWCYPKNDRHIFDTCCCRRRSTVREKATGHSSVAAPASPPPPPPSPQLICNQTAVCHSHPQAAR